MPRLKKNREPDLGQSPASVVGGRPSRTSRNSSSQRSESAAGSTDVSSPAGKPDLGQSPASAVGRRSSRNSSLRSEVSSPASNTRGSRAGTKAAVSKQSGLLPTAHPRGRQRVLPRDLELISEEVAPSPDVAAAAGTLAYSIAYDKSAGNSLDDVSSTSSSKSGSSEYVLPEGLAFSDDEDILQFDADSDTELMKTFPKNNVRMNYNPGGPQPPDLDSLPEEKRSDAWAEYKKKRKKYNDQQRYNRTKLAREALESRDTKLGQFLGCNSNCLRTMVEVESSPLLAGHTFSSKDILHIRVAEEANLRGIVLRINRSDDFNFVATGIDFYVRASFTESTGWTVNCAVCREGADILKIPPSFKVMEAEIREGRRALSTPLKAKMIVPIITNAVAGNPGIPYQFLRELLSPYAHSYAISDAILQEGRDIAKATLFGVAEENVKYAKGIAHEMRRLGHHVRILYANRKEVLQAVGQVVLNEEKTRLKKLKQTMDREEQIRFVHRWKSENAQFLNEIFGMADSTHQKTFVKGIMFATSSSKHIVPLLQDVIQADGAHSQFGKYTLFSAYGTNANGHMSPVAFGLLFGNEDKRNWSTFWGFVKEIHPSLDDKNKTILTDQDKGSIPALKDTFEHSHQFMCSFHRRENILKFCGGGKGKVPYSALWVYNMLSSCHSMESLEQCKAKYYEKMHPTDAFYLQNLPDEVQYPAARCAMGKDICMYGKSASSGVESMNKANQLARQKTAVDVLNAIILLLKLEAERFQFYQRQAWDRDEILTDKGMRLMEECFDSVNAQDYSLTVVECHEGHRATVHKSVVTARRYTVIIPSDGRHGSRFGSCTCGLPATDGVPCSHMVVVAKSSLIKGLSRIQIMPYWLTTAHWRAQYPTDLRCHADISIATVKAAHQPDELLVYCPTWSASNKKGRPKKNVREKSVSDHIKDAASKKKRKRRVRMFCSICHKYNHNTNDCYKNAKQHSKAEDDEEPAKDVVDPGHLIQGGGDSVPEDYQEAYM